MTDRLGGLSEGIGVLDDMIRAADDASLRRSPDPREWSAHDTMCHLVLNEINTASTVRRMLTEDGPRAAEIDDGSAPLFSPIYPDTRSAFEVWRALREDTIRLASSLTDEQLGRTGVVMHFGEPVTVTVRRYLEGRIDHDTDHIRQMRSALAIGDRQAGH